MPTRPADRTAPDATDPSGPISLDCADSRPLRADAERNRLRIIAAARALFAERGLDVPMDDVAEAAGVGVGTVYRRFANRDELITGIFTEHLHEVAADAERALANPDPWDAVVGVMNSFATAMAEDRGLAAIIMRIDHSHPDIEATKSVISERVEEIFDRAVQAGVLRPDLVSTDLFAIFRMLSAIADGTRSEDPGAWRRYFELFLDAISADGTRHPLATPPLTVAQLRAIQRAQAGARCHGGTSPS